MCVDVYPLGMNGERKTITFDEYFKNLDIFATACRDSDRDFWLYIQTVRHNGRTVDYDDLRWQMYVGLSFGVNTFIHFTYGCYEPGDALVDQTGKPTDLYYDAQKANLEIMALSDDYMQYKNLGAFSMNCGKAVYKYARFDNQYSDFDILKEVKSEDPLLIGCFEKKEGEGYAFSAVNLVNANDRDRSKSATLTFTLEGEHTVYAWIGGEKTILTPDANGSYTLKLDAAQGAFVVIE
jgi:hypothetical protein